MVCTKFILCCPKISLHEIHAVVHEIQFETYTRHFGVYDEEKNKINSYWHIYRELLIVLWCTFLL